MRIVVVIILIAAAAAAGWFIGKRTGPSSSGKSGERKVAFYQSSMHPWIKSDKPGNCTICGMKLTPIYEGEKGFETDASVVTLSSNSINVLNVQTETAEHRALERRLVVAGKIESDETGARMISAYVDGRIEKLFVNYAGAEVKAGEPLAVLYSPALLTAEREYLSLKAQTNFAASPALQSQHERLTESARQRLRRLGLTDEQIGGLRPGADTNSMTMVTAPIGGTVVNRSAFEGQYVKEGDKLFEIADLSRMWFRFNVYEQDLPSIAIGDVVRVTSPALGGKTFEGPIAFIEPTISQETRSARVRVELQNPIIEEAGKSRRELLNGLYADGTIAIKTEPVLAVSKSAVLNPGDQPRIYIDQGNGAYQHRPVKVGRQGDEFIEILEGLAEGEKVVTSGNLLLDSQAQLSRTSSGAEARHEHPASTAETPKVSETQKGQPEAPLSSDQIGAAKEFFASFVFPLNEHLAADKLADYNETVGHAEHAVAPLAAQFKAGSPLETQSAKIVAESKKLTKAKDLAKARADYKTFSAATVDFYRAAAPGLNLPAKIYKCPMFPKMGQNAFWVQAKAPLRNPFFGAEMLECGVEVK
jgi:membrane fusion protein, copper/silver efflux system